MRTGENGRGERDVSSGMRTWRFVVFFLGPWIGNAEVFFFPWFLRVLGFELVGLLLAFSKVMLGPGIRHLIFCDSTLNHL